MKLVQKNASANVSPIHIIFFKIKMNWNFQGVFDKKLTKYQEASSNWQSQYFNSMDITFSCALGKALQFQLQTWYIMMNCCIRDAILFCARDAIYNREARRRFPANGIFLHEFGSCCLENLSFSATYYCFLCVDPKMATVRDLKFTFSKKAMKVEDFVKSLLPSL